MRTKHFKDRMRQRNISDAAREFIYKLGELNVRGDRLVLPKKRISSVLKQMRDEIKVLENLERRGGGTLVIDGACEITIFTIDKRIRK